MHGYRCRGLRVVANPQLNRIGIRDPVGNRNVNVTAARSVVSGCLDGGVDRGTSHNNGIPSIDRHGDSDSGGGGGTRVRARARRERQ